MRKVKDIKVGDYIVYKRKIGKKDDFVVARIQGGYIYDSNGGWRFSLASWVHVHDIEIRPGNKVSRALYGVEDD